MTLKTDQPFWGGVEFSVNAHAYAYVHSWSFFHLRYRQRCSVNTLSHSSYITCFPLWFLCRKWNASAPNIVHLIRFSWNRNTLARKCKVFAVFDLFGKVDAGRIYKWPLITINKLVYLTKAELEQGCGLKILSNESCYSSN